MYCATNARTSLLHLYQQALVNIDLLSVTTEMRKCENDPNRFCYICGKVTLSSRQTKITHFVKQAYYAYFGVKLGDQDKPFAPHMCCKTYVESLRLWTQRKMKCLPFGIPMIWREGKDHITDCYFCMTNLKGM